MCQYKSRTGHRNGKANLATCTNSLWAPDTHPHNERAMDDARPSGPGPSVDASGMDAAELANVAKAIAEMTAALNAFVITAHTLYPHLNADLKLRRALRAWRGETGYRSGSVPVTPGEADTPSNE